MVFTDRAVPDIISPFENSIPDCLKRDFMEIEFGLPTKKENNNGLP